MPIHLNSLELLDRLVGFPTVSRDSNLALVEFVEAYLASYGIEAVRVPSADGKKASLYAHIGPQIEGGVVLSGHSDVVSVDGQEWNTDPFSVTERDGLLFGRGTCDMKGFLALALNAVPIALEKKIKRPLQIAISYDEETGFNGAPPMIKHMLESGMPKASMVIVGEPSTMKIVTGHKGGIGFQIHVRGHEVHSSIMHKGVSAVMVAARLIEWANQMNIENARQQPNPAAAEFDPPYTNLHVGTISGGTAVNITAKECRFDLDIRVVPNESTQMWRERLMEQVFELETEMKNVHPDTGIDVVEDFHAPGLKREELGEAEAFVRTLTGENASSVVSFMTEGGLFQSSGYSTVVCGPGSIEQAHQPDEFISIEQFKAGERFMSCLIDRLAK